MIDVEWVGGRRRRRDRAVRSRRRGRPPGHPRLPGRGSGRPRRPSRKPRTCCWTASSTTSRADALAPALGAARVEVFAEVAALDATLLALTPTEAVRALIARLADGDDLATALAADRRARGLHRRRCCAPQARRGADRARPSARPRRRHPAHDARRAGAAPAEVAALDAYLVTVCDHGLNASTFAARVVASTRAGLDLRRARRLQRAERAAARRRAGAGDRDAGRHRRGRQRPAPGSKRRWTAATG